MSTLAHRSSAAAELRGVTKVFGTVTALHDFDLALERGAVTALLGPNGAGKTTAIKLLLGLVAPTRGAVRVFGGDPRESAVRERTGAMMQVARVPETLRVGEHVDIFRSYYPDPLPRADVLRLTDLAALERRLFGKLSGGERQRVMLALALCGNPELVFLDEPTVGLDVLSRRAMWQVIRRTRADGRAVLLTTHYIEEADALADRVVLIDRGRLIADGTSAEIQQRAGAASLEDAFVALTSLAEEAV